MIITTIREHVIPAACSLLPDKMTSPEAVAMLIAIGVQESRFLHRRQLVGTDKRPVGPASGFWQFESGGGVRGVMNHPSSETHARYLLKELGYDDWSPENKNIWSWIQNNDVLAAGFARLLLWTLPDALPTQDQPEKGWAQYVSAWRPGKPHPDTWNDAWDVAWDLSPAGQD